MDIVSETQQNSRWLLGYRSKTSVSDLTPAEWSKLTRQLFAKNHPYWIISFISIVSIGFFLSEGAIGAVKSTGFSLVSVGMVLLSVVVWGVAALYLLKFLTKPTQHSKPKHRRKKAS